MLEAERDQLPLWLPVGLGLGIVAWFALPDRDGWIAVMLTAAAVATGGAILAGRWRVGRAAAWFALAVAIGCALIWWRAERVAAPVVTRPTVARFVAVVELIEPQPARDQIRLRLAPAADSGLPPRVRVNMAQGDAPPGLARGATIRLRARLMPPPEAAVPGAYDFARVAWFQGIGGTGRAFAGAEILSPGRADGWRATLAGWRARLSAHIQRQLPGGEGGVATALATGDQGAIGEADAEAMRRSGLAHLLSVSGLHVSAVVGATMLLALRLLALSPWLALRLPLLLIAAGAAAVAAIAYTALTGAEVPTLRSCIAALLVLAGIALGREAITLRLVATGAMIVLLLWPESLAGASFQLSFAAVTAIVALAESRWARALFARREELWPERIGRTLLALLATGIVVELALMPIALFHFHKAGLYGAAANIVAIPLTTFIVMPLEAAALLADLMGAGAPFWWLAGQALGLLLWIAHRVADAPGAVTMLPAMPHGAFALMVAGGLWILLWKSPVRAWGSVPLAIGAVWALLTPAPDLLITGDGRHLAVRRTDGSLALLRPRAGDYVRDLLGEGAGSDVEPGALDDDADARCGPDLCAATLASSGRRWRLVATRSPYLVEIGAMNRACADADIVVSERRLPRTCRPRWLKVDRLLLRETGGLAITLDGPRVATVRRPGDAHPWRTSTTPAAPR
ncbi:ComEC/Rec2 family competence protein [Sphingomonas sp. 1P06PA]|uniref:ComEC/Rec2 family competence protein n=1 Tax=Sphingomonas sp. 1P06PA TaxID=554121 RepID=UPI0039A5BB70